MSSPATAALFDICAVGNAIVDIIADCDEAFLVQHNIAKGVMTLVDAERAAFLREQLGHAVEMSGGSAANTAAGLAALGGKAAFIGKVSGDALGAAFQRDLQASGVHFITPPLASSSLSAPLPTARCLILVTPDAHRSMNTYLGASVELTANDIDPSLIQASLIVYLEGYLFDKPSAQAAFLLAAQIAHASGRHMALTLSDVFCVERHRQAFRQLVQDEVDILVANEHELMALYQTTNFDEAFKAARGHSQIVAATRSAAGAVLARGEEVVVLPAEPVAKVVDTTGAGDLFAAGFLHGLTYGHDLATSGRIGAIAAAEVIGHYGPRPQASLKELVARQGIKI